MASLAERADLGPTPAREASVTLSYRPEIDGLRSIAVVPVVLYHAGLQVFRGGFVGVDVFFVISGYLITGILLKEAAEGHFSLWRFYERRARRILPALFVVIAACIPLAWLALLPDEFQRFSKSILAVLGFVSNIAFWREQGYFVEASELKPLLHTWSLAVEEQFYLAFPWLIYLLRRSPRQTALWVIVALAIMSFGLCEVATMRFQNANFYLAPTRAWELLAGSICACLGPQVQARGATALSWLGLGLVLASVFFLDGTVPFPSHYALPTIVGTMLIILYAGAARGAGRLLAMRPFVAIGLISYSLYLWHQPVFAFARLIVPGELTRTAMLGLSLLSGVLAVVSWHLVEQPFRRNRGPAEARRSLRLAMVSAAALAGFGAWGFASGGIPARFDKATDAASQAYAAKFYYPIGGDCQPDPDGFVEPCTALPRPGARRVALYGDSHAQALLIAFQTAARDRQLELHAGFHGGCLPLLGGFVLNGNTLPEYCAQLAQHQFDHAVAAKVSTVFLVGRWNLYVAPDPMTPPGRYLLAESARSLFATRTQSLAVFARLLPRTVDAYRKAGIAVVLVEQVPQQSFRLDRYRQLLAYRPPVDGIPAAVAATAIPVADWAARSADVNRLIAAQAGPGVTVLDASAPFAANGRYLWGSAREPWYKDSNHLSPAGAMRLVGPIATAVAGAAARAPVALAATP